MAFSELPHKNWAQRDEQNDQTNLQIESVGREQLESFRLAPWASRLGAAAFAVVVESNGDIVAAGKANQGSNPSEFALAHFTSLGAVDASFGTGGVVTTSFGQKDCVAALALQTGGKIAPRETP